MLVDYFAVIFVYKYLEIKFQRRLWGALDDQHCKPKELNEEIVCVDAQAEGPTNEF